MKNRWYAAVLAAVFSVSALLTGCGNTADSQAENGQTSSADAKEADAGQADGETAEEETPAAVENFTYLLGAGVETEYADEYEDLDQVKYWLDHVWDVDGQKKQVQIDFVTPPAGSEGDNFNTLMATGEFQDVIDLSYASANIATLYEDGVIMDLTEAVEKYMPNYTAWLNEHPDLAKSMKVDGKILAIYPVGDGSNGDAWGGFVYRRDWIVKYGTNPETGKAFTGGWKDAEKTVWEDDVVFPSGNTDPVYISDWEWMIPILKTALEKEGIEDGYAFQLYKGGIWSTGEFTTGFGEPANIHLDREGKAVNGLVRDEARAAITCLHNWYENGWVNENFEENASDIIWWTVDTPAVYSGKVGMWFGLASQCGNALADETVPSMADMCVYAAREPINDVYGDKSCQGKDPFVFFGSSIVNANGGVALTTNAEGKDIGALLTAFDYLYGLEGGLLRSLGLSDEQQAQVQSALYNEYGLENGTYTVETAEDGSAQYVLNSTYTDNEGLRFAANMQRVLGLSVGYGVVWPRTELQQHMVDEMGAYASTGSIATSPVKQMLTADQSAEVSMINSNVSTYTDQAIPQFIRGELDVESDEDWEEYCQTVTDLQQDVYVDYLNAALGF